VAAWFIYSVYSSSGLVYIKWEIYQWWLGLYIVEYIPTAACFIYSGIYSSGGLVYIKWDNASGGLVNIW
jgi:hypothetical protein